MTEKEYREHPAVNKSTLWELRKSPMHYKHILGTTRPDTPALRFGRLVHKLVLEPESLSNAFTVAPAIDRRTKTGREEWAEFEASAGDLTIVTAEDMDTARRMADAVHANRLAMELLEGTQHELPLFWQNGTTGIDCKCRVDAIKQGTVVDYKTTTDASGTTFAREALRYGYDLQAAMYLDAAYCNGFGRSEWFFIAQEKTEPFAVNVLHADESFVERGTWQMIELLEQYADCVLNDRWPDYNATGEYNELILPDWALIPDE